MGLFDVFRGVFDRSDVATARTAMHQASEPTGQTDAITALIQRVLALGLDGKGFYKGADALGEAALKAHDCDPEQAIAALARGGVMTAAAGGFVTSLGGFVTMAAAIPVNVLTFYVTAARTVGAIAHLRGYDTKDAVVRSAILLTMVGANATDVLRAAGLPVTGSIAGLATRRLPAAAAMVVNKAIAFRLVKLVGERTLVRAGRAVPVLGGGVGALFDGAMLNRISEHARREFPPVVRSAEADWGVR
jgi:hypothetical protein